MKINFIAQSGFIIEHDSQTIAIDIWPDNPVNPIAIDTIPKVNHVFITHDHVDHGMEFCFEIAKRDDAVFHANGDIVTKALDNGVNSVEMANIGGLYRSGKIEVIQVRADHTSNTGIPLGFILKIGDRVLYHMGDTAYFKGFAFLAEVYKIDTLFVPIGGRFTMGPVEAAHAVCDIRPKYVIPMHYNTFPQIKQDPKKFISLCKEKHESCEIVVIKPGDSVEAG